MGAATAVCDCSPFRTEAEKESVRHITTNKRAQVKDDDEREDAKHEEKQVSERTKRSMTWTYLIADILHRYIYVDHACEFVSKSDDMVAEMGNVLQHLMIVGGATRDYLTGDDIADIDTYTNTRELNKIHLEHLQKYHSRSVESQADSVQCCLWRLYANKLTQRKTVWKTDKEELKCNYRLNAQFLCEILVQSAEFNGKVSAKRFLLPVAQREQAIYHGLVVTEDLVYGGYNLKGEELEMCDTWRQPIHASIHDENTLQRESNEFAGDFGRGRHPLQTSTQRLPLLDQDTDEQKTGCKQIEYEVHPDRAIDYFATCDFSINTLVTFVSDFYYAQKSPANLTYEWKVYTAMHAGGSYCACNDGVADLHNKVLRTPLIDPWYPVRRHYKPHRGGVHTFRTVKFMVKYGNEWTVDERLREETIKFYPVWLNEERFSNKERYENLVTLMIVTYAKQPSDHVTRFKAMHDLELHKHVVPYFRSKRAFREHFMQRADELENGKHAQVIRQELARYGYID